MGWAAWDVGRCPSAKGVGATTDSATKKAVRSARAVLTRARAADAVEREGRAGAGVDGGEGRGHWCRATHLVQEVQRIWTSAVDWIFENGFTRSWTATGVLETQFVIKRAPAILVYIRSFK